MIINSINNDNIKYLEKLKIKKYRDIYKEYIIEGLHLIEEAYKYGKLKKIYLKECTDIDIDIPKITVADNIFKKISSLDNSNQVIGICEKEDNNEIKGNKILLLDNIQDPGNLGTIIRSGAAFNIDTIILSNDTVDLYNIKVLRATGGLIFKENIILKDLKEAISDIKTKNIKVYGTLVDGGKRIESISKDSYAIIVGNEGNGLSNEIKEMCDDFIHIETNKSVESLNVGVVASIILYELDKE